MGQDLLKEGIIPHHPRPSGDAKRMVRVIEQALSDNKAENIVTIDLAGKTDIADFMIIASGTSNRHVSSLSQHVMDALKDADFALAGVEGTQQCDWVLVDGVNVVVHIFRPEARAFYNLEKMWQIPAVLEATV